MNLEQIDTSTTAGKVRVMQLAAEGRGVAYSNAGHHEWAFASDPRWDWRTRDYAIISEPVGPDEWFIVLSANGSVRAVCETLEKANTHAGSGMHVVRYIRADLAGEAS